MISVTELGKRFVDICEVLNTIEVKGIQNARALDKAFKICEESFKDLQDTVDELQNRSQNTENTNEEVGEKDAVTN